MKADENGNTVTGRAGRRLFCFGLGFSALALAARLAGRGWQVAGTRRSGETKPALPADGIETLVFDGNRPLAGAREVLAGASALLISVPPGVAGDPVLASHRDDIAGLDLDWIGYLSTTGVYGDTHGETVDEDAPLRPTSERGRRRAGAEDAWLDLHRHHGLPVHIFRLAGIYGPGRSVLDQIRAGQARRIDRPGHLFSRIHVEDIALVLEASLARPRPGSIYNVCDDEPAAQSDVVAYACGLLGVEPPALVPFDEAAKDMSAMARSFWADNRRVDNTRLKSCLGVDLLHPDYRSGLRAILATERAAPTR